MEQNIGGTSETISADKSDKGKSKNESSTTENKISAEAPEQKLTAASKLQDLIIVIPLTFLFTFVSGHESDLP